MRPFVASYRLQLHGGLDAIHALFDRSARHLLEELHEEVASLECELGRSLVLVAESELNDPRLVRARQLGGFGLTAQWSDDFHHALHALLTRERQGYYGDFGSAADLATALSKGFVYDGRYFRFRARRHRRSAKVFRATVSSCTRKTMMRSEIARRVNGQAICSASIACASQRRFF